MAKLANSKNSVRIIGGIHRSRQVSFPDRPDLRPTGDRIRETLFNWLQLDIAGARCLDLFAGSGILGLEALSRGASWVDFVDSDRLICAEIRANLDKLKMTNARVECGNAANWLQMCTANQPYDIVFLDPPFADSNLKFTIQRLMEQSILAEDVRIYVESGDELTELDQWESWDLIKKKASGQVRYGLLQNQRDNK